MYKKLLPVVLLLFISASVFSKGGPPSVGVACNSHYYGASGFNHVYDGVPLTYGDTATVTLEMEAGDTCFLYVSSPIGYPASVLLSRNDTTIDFTTFVFKPGRYSFSASNAFYLAPYAGIRFVLKIKSPSITQSLPPVPEVNLPGFVVYPNPTRGDLIIRAGEGGFNGSLSVTDMNGRLVWSNSVVGLQANDQYAIPSSGWQAGIYVLEMFNSTGVQRYRFVRN